jgi:hypothetical protein
MLGKQKVPALPEAETDCHPGGKQSGHGPRKEFPPVQAKNRRLGRPIPRQSRRQVDSFTRFPWNSTAIDMRDNLL